MSYDNREDSSHFQPIEAGSTRNTARQNCAEEWLHHKAQYMIVSDDQKIHYHSDALHTPHIHTYVKTNARTMDRFYYVKENDLLIRQIADKVKFVDKSICGSELIIEYLILPLR
ncbi:5381_t:CDS:2 [Funneliformis geosporum]|nr:5381_t:CDS:2 [Funneliformis geosporum]